MIKIIIEFYMENLEIIKNILLILSSTVFLVGIVSLYIKIFLNWKQITKINEKIEKEQILIDVKDLEDTHVCSFGAMNLNGDYEKLEIQKRVDCLNRKKKYLLEEISILKIFKK